MTFVIIVTTLLATIVGGVNGLSHIITGKQVLNLTTTMQDLTQPTKLGENLWLHLMVLSPLIPTLLHFLFALYALVFWPMMSMGKNHIETFWDSQASRKAVFKRQTWAGVLSLVLFAFIALLIFLFGEDLRWIFTFLWHVADFILTLVDQSYVSPP
ncbi:MAG: hypothetical protein MJK04_23330 [Psychrosphaera sp.]|nr:hypothetical protein [Psychrosphaera sp.]